MSDNLPPNITNQLCEFHPEKEICLYCNGCQSPCCASCLVQKHQQHDISTIEDKFMSADKKLNEEVKNLEENVIPKLDNLTEKANKDRSNNRLHMDEVKEEVNAFRKGLKQAVDESSDDLIKELDKIDMKYDDFITRINAQKKEVREMIQEINETKQKRDLSIIQYSPSPPQTLIPELPSPRPTIPIFTPKRDILTIIREQIGKIDWTAEISDPENSLNATTNFVPSMIKMRKIHSFSSKINVTSITSAGDNKVWVMCFTDETMYLYDFSGNEVRSVTLEGSGGINDMVIRRSGEMIVSCQDSKLRRVSVSGDVTTLIDSRPFVLSGVCLIENEELVVGMKDQALDKHLGVYSPDTVRELRKVRIIDGQGNQLSNEAYRVVYNGRDLCVACWNPNTVICVDERGCVRWIYDGSEANLKSSFCPHGIAVEKYNNLLITDICNSCVHYIDREGMLIKVIPIEVQTVFSNPWGICVDDKTGLVWIGQAQNTLAIYEQFS